MATKTMEHAMSREDAQELVDGINICRRYSPTSGNIATWMYQLINSGWDVKEVSADTECGYLTVLSDELLIEDGEETENEDGIEIEGLDEDE